MGRGGARPNEAPTSKSRSCSDAYLKTGALFTVLKYASEHSRLVIVDNFYDLQNPVKGQSQHWDGWRVISTPWLKSLLILHLEPINVVVYDETTHT